MGRSIALLASGLALLTASSCTLEGGSAHRGAPPRPYALDPAWPKLASPALLGQTVGVAVDSHGHVFIFHRADREWVEPFPADRISLPTVFMVEPSDGRLLKAWGAGAFIMPHGLSIDADDNVWVTDVGLHQVMKFSHDGQLLLTLGVPGVAGNDAAHFARPTDVAFIAGCCVLVSDGYINTRVVKFSESGQFLGQWGVPGAGPGEFDLPHGIAVDKLDRVLVADRTNARVQLFDREGRYLSEWKSAGLGRPYGLGASRAGEIFVADGGDQPDRARSRVVRVGPDGDVREEFSSIAGESSTMLAHDVAVGTDDSVYLADAWARRIFKFTKE